MLSPPSSRRRGRWRVGVDPLRTFRFDCGNGRNALQTRQSRAHNFSAAPFGLTLAVGGVGLVSRRTTIVEPAQDRIENCGARVSADDGGAGTALPATRFQSPWILGRWAV